MEGINSKAASLTGHLQLGIMNYLYAENHISIEEATYLLFVKGMVHRFEA